MVFQAQSGWMIQNSNDLQLSTDSSIIYVFDGN